MQTTIGIVQMDTTLNNNFNLAVDRLSQYLTTQSPNIDFILGTQGRCDRNIPNYNNGYALGRLVRRINGRGGSHYNNMKRGGRTGRG